MSRFAAVPEIAFESIAAAQPDLIIDAFGSDDVHATLAHIAPTITMPAVEAPWPQNLERLGRALGRDELVDQVLRERRAQGDAARAAVSQGRLAGATFAAGAINDGGFLLYGSGTTPAAQLVEMGMQPISAAAPADETGFNNIYRQLSPENFAALEEADLIVVAAPYLDGSATPDLTVQQTVRASAVWARLPAVEADNVLTFPLDLISVGPAVERVGLEFLAEILR